MCYRGPKLNKTRVPNIGLTQGITTAQGKIQGMICLPAICLKRWKIGIHIVLIPKMVLYKNYRSLRFLYILKFLGVKSWHFWPVYAVIAHPKEPKQIRSKSVHQLRRMVSRRSLFKYFAPIILTSYRMEDLKRQAQPWPQIKQAKLAESVALDAKQVKATKKRNILSNSPVCSKHKGKGVDLHV